MKDTVEVPLAMMNLVMELLEEKSLTGSIYEGLKTLIPKPPTNDELIKTFEDYITCILMPVIPSGAWKEIKKRLRESNHEND